MVNNDLDSDAGGLASTKLPSTDVLYSDNGFKDDDATLSMLGFILLTTCLS